jgi:hypothetical protein
MVTQSHSKRRLRRPRIICLPIIRCADCLLVTRTVTIRCAPTVPAQTP